MVAPPRALAAALLGASLLAGCAATTARPITADAGARAAEGCAGDGTLGLEFGELTRAMRARLDVPDAITGAVVTAVFEGGPAARAGIRPGEVVVGIEAEALANDCDAVTFAYGRSCEVAKAEIWRTGARVAVSMTPVESLPFLSARCERGDALACFRIGWLTWSRGETPADRATAVAFYERACRDGVGAACAYLGVALPDVDRTAEQLGAFERACALEDAAGCAHLAYYYASATRVPRDDARATALYVKACDLGDAKGCYNVGLMYEGGRGVARDLARAAQAYEDGCRTGSTMACTNLGWLVQEGTVGPADPVRALALYRRGCDGTRCDAPNLLGCVNLGRALRDGIGTSPDAAGAAAVFTRVCEAEMDGTASEASQVSRACALLGGMHLAGSVPAPDLARGRALSERACAGGDDFGCFNAATAYARGLGGPAEDATAASYFGRGCEVGDAESCYELAERLAGGRGVARDPARAGLLRQRACTAGFTKACAAAPR